MKLADKIKSMFLPGAEPTTGELQEGVNDLEAALAAAKAAERKAVQAVESQPIASLLELAEQSSEDKALEKARRELRRLTLALASARRRLHESSQRDEQAATDLAWANAETLLAVRSKLVGDLQKQLTKLAATHAELMLANTEAWKALPLKPASMPPTFAPHDITTRMQAFLFGVSDGRLGKGTNAHVERNRTDLINTSRQATEFILSRREVVTAGAKALA